MEVTRCARCGAFYTNGGYVCSKCETKDQLELSAFKDFMEENGLDYNSLNKVSDDTGISLSNLNRFLEYDGLEGYKKLFE